MQLEKVLSEHGLVEPIEEPQETESGVGELTNQVSNATLMVLQRVVSQNLDSKDSKP